MAGYYLNSTNSQCYPCMAGCDLCFNGFECAYCDPGFTVLYDPNIYYNDDLGGFQCQQCTQPCATCYNGPSYCTSCISGYTFTGWQCTQDFYFNFSVTLNVNQSTFNQNYYSFLTQLADMVGSSNTNVVTINSISFGSVIINGALSPTGGSGT